MIRKALLLLVLAAAAAVGVILATNRPAAFATPGQTGTCDLCHTVSATLKISTSGPAAAVAPGQSFTVNISWSGATNGNRTEVNWPNTQSNSLFNPTPRIPFSSATNSASGTTSSTLTAPSAAGVYTVRVYASYGIPSPKTNYADVVITVAAANTPPVLSPIGSRTVAVGQLLQFTISGADPDGDNVTYSASNLPLGASFNSSTRAFSWTPSTVGTYPNVTFQVSDGSQTASESITITVTSGSPVNAPPVLSPIGNKTVAVGQLLQFTISGADSDGDNVTYSASNLPSGANFNSSPHTFSWTPSTAGTYPNVTFQVSDGSQTASESITITVTSGSPVNAPPVLSPIGNKTVVVGQLFQFTVSATDPNGNNLTYSALSLPSGASFNSLTHTFSWTPTAAGTYSVTFRVSDGSLTASLSATITVNARPDSPPVLSPIGNKMAIAGQLLQFTISATDGDGDALVYSAANLPIGATFNSATQTFSWIPSAERAGRYPYIHFEVSDGAYAVSEDIVIVAVPNGSSATIPSTNVPPVFRPIEDKQITVGEMLQFMVFADDADYDPLAYSAANLPTGASFNPATQTFSWKPSKDQSGTYSELRFEVSDGVLASSESVTITVAAADTTGPTISAVAVYTVKPDSAIIRWTTDEPSTTQVEYWSSPGKLTPMDTAMLTDHSAKLTGLKPGTTYGFRARSTDKAGNRSRSSDMKFTTPASFAVSGMTISPSEAHVGEPITVGILVTNNLDVAGPCELVLRVGEAVESARTVLLAAGEQRAVNFTTARYAVGSSAVSVNGATGTISVTASDSESVGRPAGTLGLLAVPAMGACIAGIWIYRRRRLTGGKNHDLRSLDSDGKAP